MKIMIRLRNVYGNDLIYPVCAKAKAFAAIANKKTLSLGDIENIKALGFGIRVLDLNIGSEPIFLEEIV